MTQDDIHRILDKAASEAGLTLDKIDDRGWWKLTHGEKSATMFLKPDHFPDYIDLVFKQAVFDLRGDRAAVANITVFEAK